jgi:hypothetical protein
VQALADSAFQYPLVVSKWDGRGVYIFYNCLIKASGWTSLFLNRKRNWQHEPHLLEDEIPGKPQST